MSMSVVMSKSSRGGDGCSSQVSAILLALWVWPDSANAGEWKLEGLWPRRI